MVIAANQETISSLEKITEAFFASDKQLALDLFDTVKSKYTMLAKELLFSFYQPTLNQLGNFFTEVEWMLHDKPVRSFEYYYDQVVCAAELLLSGLISAFLNESGIKNIWLDVRDIIRTNNNFRTASIDTDLTKGLVKQFVVPAFAGQRIVITQGNMGATDENENTRFKKGESDNSANIFADTLNFEIETL